jgi:adenosylmethionine-8-amino-7-oxononanoate aminotransferase
MSPAPRNSKSSGRRRPADAATLDHRHVWHPFTQMEDWLQEEPIVIQSGRGAVLRDTKGREYLDANASIWTNLHGHRNPRIDSALRKQLRSIAHSSALGLANVPASHLAAELIRATQPPSWIERPADAAPGPGQTRSRTKNSKAASLQKVFFSDDGSTALEVALKLAYEVTRRQRGVKSRPRFLSMAGAYHGDTVGAVSVGQIDLFHRAYAGLCFKADRVMAPYCYRCPFNRAAPERTDARASRRCQWECVGQFETALAAQKKQRAEPYAGFIFEPRMQGAAGMIAQPDGWLTKVTDLAREEGSLLIADEVMTGFGRTGGQRLFATTDEGITPDFLCVAKGLTGGYLPMAATLTTSAVFEAFLGRYDQFKTFFHGHSYTGNQLGSAAALANLDLLATPGSRRNRVALEGALRTEVNKLWDLPTVGDIRQAGLVVGIELVRAWRSRAPFNLEERAGHRVCTAMARRGVLTRPIGNVIVLMPPYCATGPQIKRMVNVLAEAIEETLGATPSRATRSARNERSAPQPREGEVLKIRPAHWGAVRDEAKGG